MKILRLFIAREEQSGRTPKDRLIVDEKGVTGDKFYSKRNDRSILITGVLAYEIAAKENISLKPGDLGENILVDSDIRSLKPGDRLYCGDLLMEVSRLCPICMHLSRFDPRLPQLVKESRGVYLRALNSGLLNVGDRLNLKRAPKNL